MFRCNVVNKFVPGLLSTPLKQSDVRGISSSATLLKHVQAARYKTSKRGDKPLTYEMAGPPHTIAHQKSWNSWNTANMLDGLRPSETAVEDEFMRRFLRGTWHNLFLSEIIIKRNHNIIRIAGIVERSIHPRKMYFLIGYTEELLSFWLQCPVKLELQTVESRKDVVFKYI
ncbi:hypothetical protein WDU94_005109 [Cyamophila willieti]